MSAHFPDNISGGTYFYSVVVTMGKLYETPKFGTKHTDEGEMSPMKRLRS